MGEYESLPIRHVALVHLLSVLPSIILHLNLTASLLTVIPLVQPRDSVVRHSSIRSGIFPLAQPRDSVMRHSSFGAAEGFSSEAFSHL